MYLTLAGSINETGLYHPSPPEREGDSSRGGRGEDGGEVRVERETHAEVLGEEGPVSRSNSLLESATSWSDLGIKLEAAIRIQSPRPGLLQKKTAASGLPNRHFGGSFRPA
jgi:hypothetical protein